MTSLKGICRCCLSEGKFKTMKYAPPPSCSQSYAEMLNDILGFPLYSAGEVQLICSTCSNKLSQAVAFRKQVQAAELAFVDILQQRNFKIKQELLDDADFITIMPIGKIEIVVDNCLPKSIANEDSSIVLKMSEMLPQDGSSLIQTELLQKTDDICNTTLSAPCAAERKNIGLAEISESLSDKYVNVHCQKCGQHFPYKGSYRSHMRVCNLTCHSCKINFKDHSSFRRHKTVVHSEGFLCNICNILFTRKYSLSLHQRRTHMGEKNVKCAHCEFEAFNKNALRKHIRVHYNIRPYKCSICNKKFKNPSNRSFHERIHTGDKRQVCKLCGEKFVQRASLKYHLEKHHPGDAY